LPVEVEPPVANESDDCVRPASSARRELLVDTVTRTTVFPERLRAEAVLRTTQISAANAARTVMDA
jgi:hypothetical protein